MNELLGQLVVRVLLAGLVGAAALRLAGKGALQQSLQLMCGLLLVLAVVQPLWKAGGQTWQSITTPLAVDVMGMQQQNEQIAMYSVGSSIADALQKHAEHLGFSCTVRVAMGVDAQGVLQIDTVKVYHSMSDPTLQEVLRTTVANECGIERARVELIDT